MWWPWWPARLLRDSRKIVVLQGCNVGETARRDSQSLEVRLSKWHSRNVTLSAARLDSKKPQNLWVRTCESELVSQKPVDFYWADKKSIESQSKVKRKFKPNSKEKNLRELSPSVNIQRVTCLRNSERNFSQNCSLKGIFSKDRMFKQLELGIYKLLALCCWSDDQRTY